jgi:hypothetical protein
MAKMTRLIVDTSTGEETVVEFTAAEEKQFIAESAAFQAELDAKATQAEAKAALLERLGITAEEAKLLA